MTFNTGNPIGSTDARDLSDNAENFDKALGTLDATWTDRLGVTRDTFEGALSKLSFYRVGTFSAGYTLTNMRQTLEYNGHEYSWAGTFPKVVAAGATPATSGGIGAGAWVDRTDEALRGELAAVTGASLVNTSTGETVEDRLSDIDSSLSSIETQLSGKADLAGSASQTFSVADATDPHHAVSYEQYLTTPTDTMAGIVRRATDEEEIAGTSDVGFLTPLGLRNAVNAAGAAPIFAVRAWANINARTGTPIARSSGNLSSITDNAVGALTLNFATALPDANYCPVVSNGDRDNTGAIQVIVEMTAYNGTPTVKTVNALKIRLRSAAEAGLDCSEINIVIVR